MAKKKTVVPTKDPDTLELHELYKKHEYHPISERNAIEYCAGCGSWCVHLDRVAMMRDETHLVPLLPRDFGDTGPFRLHKVMGLLKLEQQQSLAAYLKLHGYGSKNAGRKKELSMYLKEDK